MKRVAPSNRHRGKPHQSFEENIRLNKKICNATCEREVFALLKRNGSRYNVVNCSTSFSVLTRMVPVGVENEMFINLCKITTSKFLDAKEKKTILPRHIAGVLWGLAKIYSVGSTAFSEKSEKNPTNNLIKTILDYSLHYKFSRFAGQEISMCVYGIAKLPSHFLRHAVLGLLMNSVHNKIEHFTSQGLSNVVYSLSIILTKIKALSNQGVNAEAVVRPDTYILVLRTVIAKMSLFNAQEVSNVLLGIAKIGFSIVHRGAVGSNGSSFARLYTMLHDKVDAVATKVLNSGSTQNVVNFLWAMVKIESDEVVTQQIPFQQAPKSWDIERLGFVNTLFKKCLKEIKPMEISMILWAFSRNVTFRHACNNAQHKYNGFFAAIFSILNSNKDLLNAQQLSTVAMALARLNYSNGNESKSSTTHALHNSILSLISRRASEILEDLSFQDLENILISLEKMDTLQLGKKDYGFKTLLKKSVGRAIALFEKENQSSSVKTSVAIKPQNVCNFMLALAKFKWKRELNRLISHAEKYILQNTKDLTPRDIANIAWAFAKLGQGRRVVQHLSDVTINRMKDFNAQEMSKLLYAVDKCNVTNKALQRMYSNPVALTFEFNNMDSCIKINHLPGGGRDQSDKRELSGATGATGCSLWDPSIALSHFLSDHFYCASDNAKKLQFPNCKFDFDRWSANTIVELGSGIGLCSVVAGKVFGAQKDGSCHVISTDGDDNVCKLLSDNIQLNNFNYNTVEARKVNWGIKGKELRNAIGLSSVKQISLVMASGCVYGSDPNNWKSLLKTIRSLCKKNSKTLIILSHGNGAAPGVFEGSGTFYNDFVKKKFNVYIVPPNFLNPKYREGCSIHLLWRR